jgi:DNA repair exonuclease SbcCD ATPase subunit
MIEQINKELLKLQEELSKFDGTVGQLAKAGEISQNLIDSSKNLQKSFAEQLNKIENLFSEYMNKTYSHSEEKIDKIFQSFQERMEQEQETFSKITELSTETEKLTQETVKKISEQNSKLMNQLLSETQKTLEEQKEYTKLQIEQIQKDISKLLAEHTKKLEKEQQVLDNYVELASATAELSKHLKSVNFPERLDNIAENISESHKTQKLTHAKVEKIDEKHNTVLANTQKLVDSKVPLETLSTVRTILNDPRTQQISEDTAKTKKRIGSTKFFVILIFIITLLFYGFMTFVFFTLFPHFFEDMF